MDEKTPKNLRIAPDSRAGYILFESRVLASGEPCPACKARSLSQTMYLYQEPKTLDEILIFTTHCDNCGFKKADTMPVQPSHHARAKRFILHVESIEDMDSKIYRASTASIEIPDLEILLEPGLKADFFITNVEGVLLKFKEICLYMLRDENEDKARDVINARIKDIDSLLALERPFRVIIDDADGFSYVLPARDAALVLEQDSKRAPDEHWETPHGS